MKSTTLSNISTNPGRLLPTRDQVMLIGRSLMLPLIGILLFLFLWFNVARMIDTSLGEFPGPVQVCENKPPTW